MERRWGTWSRDTDSMIPRELMYMAGQRTGGCAFRLFGKFVGAGFILVSDGVLCCCLVVRLFLLFFSHVMLSQCHATGI